MTGLRNGVCRVSSLRGPLPLLVGPRCFLGCELRWWSEDEPVCSRVYGVFVRAEYVCARVEKFRECVGVEEVRVHVCGFECGGRVCGLEEVCECRVPLWPVFTTLHLVENMRARRDKKEFAEWLLKVGDEVLQSEVQGACDTAITIPAQCIAQEALVT